MEGDYLSARAAGRYLGVSARTVRRWIQAGRIAATKGPAGWEISRRDLDTLREAAPGQAEAGAPMGHVPQGVAPGEALAVLIEELRIRREEVADLQEENRNLAGQLGFAQARIQHLEEEVRLLTAGETEGELEKPQLPWWRRWFRR